MRYRLMATYRGVPYEAGVGPTGGDVVLFAACPPPEELGFEPATGHWRKQVIWAEVDGLWESRPVGIFRGEPCVVLDDLGDRLHIAYLGTDADRAALLGYWQVDRGVFELLAPREELSSLTEERVDRPLRWTPRPPAGPPLASAPSAAPARPSNPYGTAAWPAARLADLPPGPNGAGALPSPGWPASSPDVTPGTGQFPITPAGGSLPATTMPGAAMPDTAMPDTAMPDTAMPDTAMPDTAMPDTAMPDTTPPGAPGDSAGGRSARRQRVSTREIFCELADLAAIPRSAYALESEVDGAMCLLANRDGFEVFVAVDGARHEIRVFADEEAAYFYLFGVLVAESIRHGSLVPGGAPAYPDR